MALIEYTYASQMHRKELHMGASFPAGCPVSRAAGCVVQRCDTGVTPGLSGEQSSALGCNLVLVFELGQIASLLSHQFPCLYVRIT